jgi:glucuronate isomerase
MSTCDELLSYIESLPVIDTHEHLPEEPERIAQEVDFFTLFSHYAGDDMVATI